MGANTNTNTITTGSIIKLKYDNKSLSSMTRVLSLLFLSSLLYIPPPSPSIMTHAFISIAPITTININNNSLNHSKNFNPLRAKAQNAPTEAQSDIIIPNLLHLHSSSSSDNNEDPRVWVPQTPNLSFRPLCLNVSQGYYVNLLKFKGGGILGKHRHSSPVHALTLEGSWGYDEHPEWHASKGTYVFEPPGETHTLRVDQDCEVMIALFHVTGALLYVDEKDDENVIGFDDVFTKLEKAKAWYRECGLGEDYVQQFVR
mmetsp:Transcript_12413/g.17719  ORF Transcript_12413/g.17719 Transcript_12413/m.17719 type:complete len:258 (+) Transcript_12413:310-1083(+)